MLLAIPRFNEYGFIELNDALKKISTFSDEGKWNHLKFLLDSQISDKLGGFKDLNSNVISILEVYTGFPQEIDGLLERIKTIESEHIYYKELFCIIFQVAKKQQEELENKINKSCENKIDKIIGTNKNNINHDFQDFWSSLCKILEDIDWENIWRACQLVFDTSRKHDWRDEIQLKSICFTKNYSLLKKFFIEENNPDIITSFAQTLSDSLNDSNQALIAWLGNSKQPEKDNSDSKQETEECEYIPILLVIADRNEDDSWMVQAQLKYRGIQEKIEIDEERIIGIKCDDFEQIPSKIENYIDYLNNEPKFKNIPTTNLPIEKLRIEVFIPIINLELNFDCWAKASEDSCDNYLVQSNRLFLRSRERYKGKKGGTCRRMLVQGWRKLEENKNQSISTTLLTENIDDTQQDCHEICIEKNNQVDNWTKLQNFMRKCSKLWWVRLQDTLPEDINERGRFFQAIYVNGIPIVCWQWESIIDDLKKSVEDKLQHCFCCESLSKRCHNLLEQTWELRSNAWGETNEAKRKQSPGYYFGMLLEDPEIMPDDVRLKTAGGRKLG